MYKSNTMYYFRFFWFSWGSYFVVCIVKYYFLFAKLPDSGPVPEGTNILQIAA